MKGLLFAPFLFCFALFAHAQGGGRPLRLHESLEMSLANSGQLKKSKLDRQALEQRLKEGRGAAYPRLTTNVNLDYLPILPTTILPGTLFGQPEGTYIPAQFGRPWQLSGSFTAEQPIYNESLRRGVPAISISRNIYDLLTERTEEEVLFNTATIFYQALQTEQLLRAVNANVDKLDALQRMAELQLANGYAIPTDVKRIRVARTNLETQRQNLLTAISGLRQTLQFFCGISYDEAIQPIEDMTNPAADSLSWQNLHLETETTTEYRILLRTLELTRVQERSLRAGSVPNLSAYATGLFQSQRGDANFFDTGTRWYGMAVVGVKLNMPIFDGFRRHNRAGFLKIDWQKLEEDRIQLAGAKELEFRQAREQLNNALRALRTQTDNVALAHEITDKLLLQYKEGVVSLTDLLNAQTALSEAETNYWQQVFGYKLAVLKLLKVTGKLETLREGK